MIKLNEKFLSPFVRANEVAQMEAELEAARRKAAEKISALTEKEAKEALAALEEMKI